MELTPVAGPVRMRFTRDESTKSETINNDINIENDDDEHETVLEKAESRTSSTMDTSDDLQLQNHMQKLQIQTHIETEKKSPVFLSSEHNNSTNNNNNTNSNGVGNTVTPRSFSVALQQRLSEQKELWSNINNKLHEFENIKQHIAQEYPKMKQKLKEYQDQISELRLQNQQMTYMHYEQSKQQNETIEKLMDTNKKMNEKYQTINSKLVKYQTENQNLHNDIINKSDTIIEYKSLLEKAVSNSNDKQLKTEKQLKRIFHNQMLMHMQSLEKISSKLQSKTNLIQQKLNQVCQKQHELGATLSETEAMNSLQNNMSDDHIIQLEKDNTQLKEDLSNSKLLIARMIKEKIQMIQETSKQFNYQRELISLYQRDNQWYKRRLTYG